MSNWQWLLLGGVGGFLLARSGASIGTGLSFSTGVAVRGAGQVPLDQPDGTESYQQVGVWNPEMPGASFAVLTDQGDAGDTIENNVANGEWLS